MGRGARARGDAGRDGAVLGGEEVRSPHPGGPRLEQLRHQEVEPVGVREAVVVGVGDDLAPRQLHPHVARHREAPVPLGVVADVRVAGRDVGHGVGGAVVDEDDLVVRVAERLQRAQAAVEGLRAVVAADHDRHLGIARQGGQRALLAEDLRHPVEGGLGRAVAPHQAEGPVRDRMAAREPLVRVGEAAGPGEALAVDFVEVHGQELRLLLLAVAQGVDPVFPEDERLLVRLVLQALQVGPELLPPVEVDVHGVEVHRPGVQIFGGREAGERDQRPGILLVGEVDQLVDEALDLLVAEPAHDVGGNLVHDRQGEEGGVPAARAREELQPHPPGLLHDERPLTVVVRQETLARYRMEDAVPESQSVLRSLEPLRARLPGRRFSPGAELGQRRLDLLAGRSPSPRARHQRTDDLRQVLQIDRGPQDAPQFEQDLVGRVWRPGLVYH